MKLVFMGTPEFAVASLDALIKAGHEVAAVVTMPDKPAGRGQKIQKSAVKLYAEEHGLKILQPEKLKDEAFINELREINADIQVVVAFRMLPEIVWNMPPKGTYNVHGSLLPCYRGAAPINWAIMNGDEVTGVTTFKLTHDIDTGDIALQRHVFIESNDDAGTIHDRLMKEGAIAIVETLDLLEKNELPLQPQSTKNVPAHRLAAPKIFKEDMKINWTLSPLKIINKVRGLSPYPAAWTDVDLPGKKEGEPFKILKGGMITLADYHLFPGEVYICRQDSMLIIGTGDPHHAYIVDELQPAGKKRMDAKTFINGLHFEGKEYISSGRNLDDEPEK